MLGLFTIVAVGLLLGMRHATDPDHVIAVTTIITREHNLRRSAWIGAAWGVGHTLTILLVGGAIILFHLTLPSRVGLAMELAVALMLIFLGIRNLVGLFLPTRRDRVHKAHNHAHGDGILFHHHSQSDDFDSEDDRLGFLDRWFRRFRVYQMVRPLAIGIVHGLAGSAAVALLVLGTIPNARWAIAYLAVFGIGTVLGMMLITLTISSTFSYGQRHFAQIGRHFGLAAGGISLAFGAFIFYQIGFVNGLFTANATWIPR